VEPEITAEEEEKQDREAKEKFRKQAAALIKAKL